MATTTKPTAPARRGDPAEFRRVQDLIRQKNVQVVDVKFTDLPGTWQHFSIPAATLDEDMIREGLGFDGSSIRGFQAINESDMLLIPDLTTAFVDPVLSVPTLSITCDIYDPITREPYSRDPRFIAFKAEEYLKTTGIATTSYWGPEAEFFIFNSVRFDQNAHEGYYHVDAEEGRLELRSQRDREPGPPAPAQGGIFPGAAGRPAAGRPVEDHAGPDRGRGPGRGAAPRGGHRRPGRDRLPVRHPGADRRPTSGLQVRGQECLPQSRPHGDVHAQATLRRQRLGNARPPVALEGRPAAVLRRQGLCPPVRYGALVHRRADRPRPRPAGHLRPDHQQLPAAGAGLRGAGQPDVLAAQPVGDLPDPNLQREPQGAPGRVPRARSLVQSVPRLRRAAHGGARRRSSASSSRPSRSTRISTSCTTSGSRASRRCPARWARRSMRWRPITPSCSRETSSPPTCSRPGSSSSAPRTSRP